MSRTPDYIRKKYAPLLDKTLQNALAHTIGEQFPRIGGPRAARKRASARRRARRGAGKPRTRGKGAGRGTGPAQRAKPVWSARNRPPHHHP
jgi:hypothetical protein